MNEPTPLAPIALAPLVSPSSSAPTPLLSSDAATPGNARRNVRVSLTGEVLDDAPVPAAPASGAYAPPQAHMPSSSTGRNPLPSSARPLPASSLRRESVPDNSDKKAFVINLCAAFLFLALCGGGGGWYWTHRTNPKAQVTRYIHAIQWLDWGVVYDLSAPPPGNKSRHEFVSVMDDKFDNNGLYKIAARKRLEKIPLTIGEPQMRGNEATVVVTRGATPLSEAKSLPLTLTNDGGVWKIHPLGENPLDMLHDPDEDKKAAAALLRSLFPDKAGSSGNDGSSGTGGSPPPR